jgi:hypothetical protein
MEMTNLDMLVDQFPISIRVEGREFLIHDRIRRSVGWIKKSEKSKDSFDRYISLFISFNILYNLYAKVKNPRTELIRGDYRRAQEAVKLIRDHERVFNEVLSEINPFEKVCLNLNFRITVEHEDGVFRLQQLLDYGNSSEILRHLLKMLYVIRCNLVHGEKGVDDRQSELLRVSSALLKALLEHMLEGFIHYLRRVKRH